MLSDDILADGWEWSSGARKVRKGRGHYIRVGTGSYIKYVGVGRGDKDIKCKYPYLKLAVLTHYDEEIRELLRDREAERRRKIRNF